MRKILKLVKLYRWPLIKTSVVIIVMSGLIYLTTHCWSDVFNTVIIGYGISICSNINYSEFDFTHHRYIKANEKVIANFNQVDEDICRLQYIIGSIYNKSSQLHIDLTKLDQDDLDFTQPNVQDLINETVNGIWSFRKNGYKLMSAVDSRYVDIKFNLPNNRRGRKAKKYVKRIYWNIYHLVNNQFYYMPTAKLLRKMITSGILNQNFKTIDDALVDIHQRTSDAIDDLRDARKKLQMG